MSSSPLHRQPIDASSPPVAVINDRAAQRLRGGHPWVYRSDVAQWPTPLPAPGEAMGLRDSRGRGLGVADFSRSSQIALRRLSSDPEARLNRGFFLGRLQAALAYRQAHVRDTTAYRLVWGEADGLPGLVVDRYGAALVFQTLTQAMAARQELLLELLDGLLHPAVIVERNDAKVRVLEELEVRAQLLRGDSAEVAVRLNGLEFELDLLHGQKTGGFLDQRENWAAVTRFLPPAPAHGLEALDLFTYQGGFAIHLARHCRKVEAVDISRPALVAAEANARRNQITNIDWIEANAFDLLREYQAQGRRFDVVVLDPPAFAKNRSALANAERGYKEINLRALKLLRPGGILVSCSCSHHVAEAELLGIIAGAALDAGRELTVLERRTQALDHPVLLTVPETLYLKCLLFQVR